MYERMHSFSREELDRLHTSTLEIFGRVGVALHDPEAVEIFRKHGARTEGNKVFPDEKLLSQALETAPAEFFLQGRNPQRRVKIGGDSMALVPAYGAPFIITPQGEMRPALMADYDVFCKLVQTSDHLDMNGYLMVEPSDAAPGLSYLEMMLSNLLLCDRPFMGAQTNRRASREAIQMAALACGGEEPLRANPPMLPIISVMSPLHYSAEMAGSLIEYARAGLPVMCASAAMAGSSGPVTLAGVLALDNAESLAGLILTQLVNPGNPFIYGATSAPMDMRSGGMCIGAVETSLLVSGTIQLARFYNLPSRSGGTLTDAPFPDFQAGVESTLGLTTAVRGGANFILHAAGILGSFIAMSFEKFLLDEELCGMVRKLVSPLDLSTEAIDLEMIQKVGVGGHYLTQPKTFKLCRTEFFLPKVFNRTTPGQWTQAGRPRPEENAAKVLEARLAAYRKPDIDPGLEADLKRFVAQRKG